MGCTGVIILGICLFGFVAPFVVLREAPVLLGFSVIIVVLIAITLYYSSPKRRSHKTENIYVVTACLVIAISIISIICSVKVNNNRLEKENRQVFETDRDKIVPDENTDIKYNISAKVPYVSMPEKYINSTALGQYTAMERCVGYDALIMSHRYKTYIWEKDGKTIFRATVIYNEENGWHVSNIWDVSGTNNAEAIRNAPYEGMHPTEDLKSRWVWEGTSKLNGVNTTHYRYDVGDYTYSIWLSDSNTVLKVSTTKRGR